MNFNNVADIRRSLCVIRQSWQNHSLDDLFDLSKKVPHDLSLQEFAYQFILTHHQKRITTQKSK